MAKDSAGILMYRWHGPRIQVLLIHPGGPYWAQKDLGAWSIPKGEFGPGEHPLQAAKREFEEETGLHVDGRFVQLTPRRQSSGKLVHIWAVEGDCDAAAVVSNTFKMEWPPHSGRLQEFPEADRADWFGAGVAREKLHKGQIAFLDELEQRLAEADPKASLEMPGEDR